MTDADLMFVLPITYDEATAVALALREEAHGGSGTVRWLADLDALADRIEASAEATLAPKPWLIHTPIGPRQLTDDEQRQLDDSRERGHLAALCPDCLNFIFFPDHDLGALDEVLADHRSGHRA